MKRDTGIRAIAELVLIVVGVLVAFALESWWSGRADAEVEEAYLIDLREEFVAARSRLDSVVAQHRVKSELLHSLDAKIAAGDVAGDSVAALGQILWLSDRYDPITPVYDELMSSAGVQTITSGEVRRSLFEYERAMRGNRELDDFFMESYVRSWEPRLTERVPILLFSPPGGVAERIALAPGPDELASDLVFRNLVSVRAGFEDIRRTQREELLARVERVIASVDSEIGR